MKQQTCWTILRHFGYTDKLTIKQNLWDDGSITDEEINACKNIELSKDSISYLKKLFEAYKTHGINKLEESGMEKIFATTETGLPWKVKQETHYNNGVSFETWIALWQKFMS